MSDLRSRIDDWRAVLRKFDPAKQEADARAGNIADSEQSAQNLSVVLESLVIPKLIADRKRPACSHDADSAAAAAGSTPHSAISDDEVSEFARLSLEREAGSLLDVLDGCLSRGSSVETIFVDLLAPAARHLGELWEADACDFVDVTMALWRIQEVLRELTLCVPPAAASGQGLRSALFSTMPGEQHSLGTLMVAECFQRAGWETQVLMEPTQSELIGTFADRHYDLVGLTITNDCPRAELSGLVNAIRSVSSNPGIRIMMGGRVIIEQPELVECCGGDGTAMDAPSAVDLANSLVPLEAVRRARPL
ncbi:MAG: cobalamin-dependent protein [Pseudomonadota bacterium]